MQNTSTGPTDWERDAEQTRIWETNHKKILEAITAGTKYYGSHVPTITEISAATGLSRQTIYLHFKNAASHPAYKQRSEVFESLEVEVLMKVCHKAMLGDLKAAKLYLELTGKIKPKEVANAPANNYIQVNDMVLNQQVMQSLNPEHLKKIEDIIKSAISTNPEPAKIVTG